MSFIYITLYPLDAFSVERQLSEDASTLGDVPQFPKIYDIDLQADIVFSGLNFPTSIAFLGPDDMLVLEKNTGQVKRILNGTLLPDSLLNLNVSRESERGMLGIVVKKNSSTGEQPISADVFIYFTESTANDKYNQTLGNHLYKYQFKDNKLVNPKRLLDLPSSPGPPHNGGRIKISPDNNVYFTVGDLNQNKSKRFKTLAENLGDARAPDGRAGILRITQDGQPVPNGSIIGDQYPMNLYYAYGIRNSFGIDFDPITGNLWDTENGPGYGDEINLVKPGFNSGWKKVQGIWEEVDGQAGPIFTNSQGSNVLEEFGGRGKYSDPEFIWANVVGPTALKFLNSDSLGREYENDMFVGDIHNGIIYRFDLTNNRTALALDGPLKDKMANISEELRAVIFGQGFGGITDLEVGPDGYLYILSVDLSGIGCVQECSYSSPAKGTIFRVVPLS